MARNAIHDVDFRVPNTKKGQRFIEDLRSFINRDKYQTVLARTRGPREPGEYQCKREKATAYGVYLKQTDSYRDGVTKALLTPYTTKYSAEQDLKDLANTYESKIKTYESEAKSLRQEIRSQATEIQRLDALVDLAVNQKADAEKKAQRIINAWGYVSLAALIAGSLIGYLIHA